MIKMKYAIVLVTVVVWGSIAKAQTYSEVTGNSFATWKQTYDFNLKTCTDITKRPSASEALILENTLAITRARVSVSERFVPQVYQEKFKKIVEARKKAVGGGSDSVQLDPNKYMKKFDFHGYCVCRNDVSKFVPNETAYKAIALQDMQQIEDGQEIKCLVDNATL